MSPESTSKETFASLTIALAKWLLKKEAPHLEINSGGFFRKNEQGRYTPVAYDKAFPETGLYIGFKLPSGYGQDFDVSSICEKLGQDFLALGNQLGYRNRFDIQTDDAGRIFMSVDPLAEGINNEKKLAELNRRELLFAGSLTLLSGGLVLDGVRRLVTYDNGTSKALGVVETATGAYGARLGVNNMSRSLEDSPHTEYTGWENFTTNVYRQLGIEKPSPAKSLAL